MKVRELIAALQGLDPEKRIVLREEGTGYNDIGGFRECRLRLNAFAGDEAIYCGHHAEALRSEPFDEVALEIVAYDPDDDQRSSGPTGG